QRDVDRAHQPQAEHRVARVDVALDPVLRRAVTVTFHGLGVVRFLHLQHHPGPQHAVDAVNLRAVRVVLGLALGVVLAVDGSPFLGHHAGGEPQPQAEEVGRRGVQFKRAMCLIPMQIDGYRGNRDVREAERDEHQSPPWKVQQTVEEHQVPLLCRLLQTGRADSTRTANACIPGKGQVYVLLRTRWVLLPCSILTSRCGKGISIPRAANSDSNSTLTSERTFRLPSSGSLIQKPSSRSTPLSASCRTCAVGAGSLSTRG